MHRQFLFIIGLLLLAPQTHAQSCEVEPTPIVGQMQYIKGESVRLSRIARFDPQELYGSFSSNYSFRKYTDMVKEFVSRDYVNLSPVSKTDEEFNTLSIPGEVDILPGDIVFHGPPKFTCRNGMYGVFTDTGEPKAFIFRAEYQQLKDPDVNIAIGKEIHCSTHSCTVEADFTVGEETFSLQAGNSHQPALEEINSITLLRATKGKRNNFGIDTYAHVILDVTGANLATPEPQGFWQKIKHFFTNLF